MLPPPPSLLQERPPSATDCSSCKWLGGLVHLAAAAFVFKQALRTTGPGKAASRGAVALFGAGK